MDAQKTLSATIGTAKALMLTSARFTDLHSKP